MLHITNGDQAAGRIARAGVSGDVLPWLDVLHEGPVPAGLPLDELREVRARFIAEQGWADFDRVARDFARRDAALAGSAGHDEVVLWFEHDLYDQLQLVQLLDWFAQRDLGATRLSLICVGEYLGTLGPERMRDLFHTRHAVSAPELALGRRAWQAFRAPDPLALSALLREDTSALPFLEGALLRHLEQFPSVRNGLSRSEAQALDAIASGRAVLSDAFVASHQEREERIFLGDTVFASYLERLSRVSDPLVLLDDGSPIVVPRGPADSADFWSRRASLTELGRTVLAGREDWIAINGIERWLGGVHLRGAESPWRWDLAARQLQPAGV